MLLDTIYISILTFIQPATKCCSTRIAYVFYLNMYIVCDKMLLNTKYISILFKLEYSIRQNVAGHDLHKYSILFKHVYSMRQNVAEHVMHKYP